MIQISDIHFDANRIMIPTAVDLTNHEEVIAYVNAAMFHLSAANYTVYIVSDYDVPDESKNLIVTLKSDMVCPDNKWIDFVLNECDDTVYHKNIVFEPAYLQDLFVDDLVFIELLNTLDGGNALSDIAYGLLMQYIVIDGSLIDTAPPFTIACPQANALISLLDNAIAEAGAGNDLGQMTNNNGILTDTDRIWVLEELKDLREMFTQLVEQEDGCIEMHA